MKRIPIGVSACLLGEPVRYDGGHKREPLLGGRLAERLRFIALCPEAGCGLGVPREPMELVADGATTRLVTLESRIDHTARLAAWIDRGLERLATEGVHGYLFKARSPSCGPAGVPIRGAAPGAGLFAAAFAARFPHLPILDEAGLHDPERLDAFLRQAESLFRRAD